MPARQLPCCTAFASPAQHTDTRNFEQSFAVFTRSFTFHVHVIVLVCDVHENDQSSAQQMMQQMT